MGSFQTQMIIDLLERAAVQLEHPEVQEIQFAIPPAVTANQLRNAMRDLAADAAEMTQLPIFNLSRAS